MVVLAKHGAARWLLGIVGGAFFLMVANFFIFSIPSTSADLQTNLDWCMTNSGTLAGNEWPGNITYEQCAGLALLYEDTNGDNWTSNSGWFQSTDICADTWHGLDCYFGIILSLSNNNLSGVITDLSGIGSFRETYLSNNNITAINVDGFWTYQLNIDNNPLTAIDFSNIASPENRGTVVLDNTNATSVDISNLTGLYSFSIINSQLNDFVAGDINTYAQSGTLNLGISNNYICESSLDATSLTFLNTRFPDWQLYQTCVPPLGSVGNPYPITTCEELQAMTGNLTAYYKLTQDIDCSDTVNRNNGSGFAPIGGFGGAPFEGGLDGSGYTINDLYINIYGGGGSCDIYITDDAGLFGYANGATFENINMSGHRIQGCRYVGALVGRMDGGTIDNIHVNGYTRPFEGYYGGGIAGGVDGTTITNSSSAGQSRGSGIFIGGLVGHLENGSIDNSHSISQVDGGSQIGGLVGWLQNGVISNSYATGLVLIEYSADNGYFGGKAGIQGGGLVGLIDSGTITNSYAAGNVSGDIDSIGGLIGYAINLTLSDSYAEGDVIAGGSYIGGLIGYAGLSTISNVYAQGDVDAPAGYNVGGLVGWSENSDTQYAYAQGNVTGYSLVGGAFGQTTLGTISYVSAEGDATALYAYGGGLVGSATSPSINNCYALGDASSPNSAGSLFGLTNGGSVGDCFSVGSATGDFNIGGIVGLNNGLTTAFTNVFGDSTNWHPFYDDAEGGSGLTTAEMQDINTYQNAGWAIEINDDAVYNDGYPILTWQVNPTMAVWYINSNSSQPEGVLAYSGTAITPAGFVRIVDDINNPQWMVYMRQYPIGGDSDNPYGNELYNYGEMQGYIPADNQAIPTTALKNLLVTSNGSTTWVSDDGTMYDFGNWSDWLSDPESAGDGDRNLMSVAGRGQEGIYFEPFSYNTNGQNHIRTIYTSYYTPPDTSLAAHIARCSTNSGNINVPEQECIGLAYLYEETNGDNWYNNDGWFDDTDVSNWKNNACYGPVDQIIDILGTDQCNNSDWFVGSEFYRAVMLTGDGLIKNVYGINLAYNNLDGAIGSGLAYFPELRIVDIQDNEGEEGDGGLTAVNLSQNPLLEIADISDNDDGDIRTLDLSNNPLLWALNVDDLYLEGINLSNNTGLIYVDIDGNELDEFDTNGLDLLQYLDISSNNIADFTSYAPALIVLDAYENSMDSVNLSNSPLLEEVDLADNNLEIIDLSLLTVLDYLNLGYNNFTAIDLTTNVVLTDLDIADNDLQAIDVSMLSLLQYLDIEDNDVSDLDISSNLALYDLEASYNAIATLTTAPFADYSSLSDIEIDYNGLCHVTNTEVLNILNTYAGSWMEYQYFCPPRSLEMTIDDNPIEIAWNSPQVNAGNQDNSTNVMYYTISWSPGNASGMIDLGEEYYNNTTHSWDYTIEGLENGTEYTFTVCAVHSNEGPARTVCSTIQGTPGGQEQNQSCQGGCGSGPAPDYCPNGDNSGSYYDGKCDGTTPGKPVQVKLPKLKLNQIEKKNPLEFCRYNDTKGVSAAFTDIVGTPYASAVGVLVSHCLVQGYNNNGQEFGINDPLKRGELYKVFTRMALLDFDLNYPGLGWSHGYKIAGETAGLWKLLSMSKDQSAAVTQQELLQVTMNYLAYMGVLDEAPEFVFGAKEVTRGEFAKFINTVLGLVSTK